MARPRTIAEQDILAATAAAIGRVGPAKLTLADVASAAGVSTGLLVQRYKSKRGLLLAFSGQAAALTDVMRRAYDDSPDPLTGLITAVVAATGDGGSPEEFANHLAYLHLELADAEFRALLAAHSRAMRSELGTYLSRAMAARQLVALDVDDLRALAELVDSVRNGAQIAWATHRDGELADVVRGQVVRLLEPYRIS